MNTSFCKLAFALMTLAAPLAQAAPVLWNNGGPATLNPGGSNMSGFNSAANFTTTFTTNLSTVSFWSLEAAGSYAGSITFGIFGNVGGSPGGAALASGNLAPTRTPQGTTLLPGSNTVYNIVEYDFNVTLNNLAAGDYWLTLHDGPLNVGSEDTDFLWSWADDNATNGGLANDQDFEFSTGGPWLVNSAEHAFLITGDRVVQQVSEPATLLLSMMAAGLGLVSSRRRRTA